MLGSNSGAHSYLLRLASGLQSIHGQPVTGQTSHNELP